MKAGLLALFVLTLGSGCTVAQENVRADEVWKVVREVGKLYESIETVDYEATLRSPELEGQIAAKAGGLAVKTALLMIRRGQRTTTKVIVPDVPQPFRGMAEDKLNKALEGNFGPRILLQEFGWNFGGAFLRKMEAAEQFDLIEFSEERMVVEFNDLSETFTGKVLRSARFTVDRRRLIVERLSLWFGGRVQMSITVEHSPTAFFPGTRAPVFQGMRFEQTGFPGPPKMSMVADSIKFNEAVASIAPGQLSQFAVWKAALAKAGVERWRIEKIEVDPDGKLRWDLAKAPLADFAVLQGMPFRRLDLSGTGIRDLEPLRGMPLESLNLSDTAVTDLTPLAGAPLSSLSLRNVKVGELTPLAGMPLVELDLQGTAGIADLAALAGTRLEVLNIENFPVKDLAPLKGMPLRELLANGTQVADLTPLVGMPLEKLQLARTKVRDLTPLAGAPLGELDLADCGAITDIAPLAGMPLRVLHLTRIPKLKDIAPLRGMKLERLNLSGSQVTGIDVLAGMPLVYLSLSFAPMVDLAPVAGMPLKELYLEKCSRITSIQPLAGMALEILNMDMVPASDLDVLKGMPLRKLNIGGAPITDLGLLAGMPLEELHMAGCKQLRDLTLLREFPALRSLHLGYDEMTDIGALRGLPLKTLYLHESKVTDLSPLAECVELEMITFPPEVAGIETLRKLPKVKLLNDRKMLAPPFREAADFWREYDGRKK